MLSMREQHQMLCHCADGVRPTGRRERRVLEESNRGRTGPNEKILARAHWQKHRSIGGEELIRYRTSHRLSQRVPSASACSPEDHPVRVLLLPFLAFLLTVLSFLHSISIPVQPTIFRLSTFQHVLGLPRSIRSLPAHPPSSTRHTLTSPVPHRAASPLSPCKSCWSMRYCRSSSNSSVFLLDEEARSWRLLAAGASTSPSPPSSVCGSLLGLVVVVKAV